MHTKFPLALMSALLLLGAGCASSPTPVPPANSPVTSPVTSPATSTPPASTSTPVTPPATRPQVTPDSLTPAATDGTWQTYVNKALGFSFMWPTKGRYAPQWQVAFQPLTSASIAEGCWAAGTATRHVSAGGQVFCHSTATTHEGEAVALKDYYVTTIGKTHVVISFSKTVYETHGACAAQPDAAYSSIKGGCAPFSETEYRSALDGIVGTFKAGGA